MEKGQIVGKRSKPTDARKTVFLFPNNTRIISQTLAFIHRWWGLLTLKREQQLRQ